MGKLIILQWFYISRWSREFGFEYDHVHVFRRGSKQKFSAKFNIETLEFVEKGDFSSKELKRIEKVILENLDTIKNQLNVLDKGGQVKAIKISKKGK
ncbi:MAG: DUF4160 domain-containing protein [Bacteroidetes bacterium]|nr:DUF4160 domain-containing protein [Bacteroidota bacterium]